jgi:hypothetical protein
MNFSAIKQFADTKKIALLLLICISFSCVAQTLPDSKENNTFAINYMGYSRYIVSGYYGQLTNFTDQVLIVQIDYSAGTAFYELQPFEEVAFNLEASQYVRGSKIVATVLNVTSGCQLTCKVKGACT